jgi:glycosyltransferase involved in cell wall biosynthesis
MSPLISTILSVRNDEELIASTIESILSQTLSDFELIIINDGSTDKTGNIIKNYSQKDKRIVFINQSRLGLTRSLNKGLEIAKGTYIARQDSGDISFPERFEKQVRYLENHPLLSGCFSWTEVINLEGQRIGEFVFNCSPRIISKRLIRGSNIFVHGSVLLRREIILHIGGYDESMISAQDFDLWLRMIKHKYNLGSVSEFLYKWRLDPTSISFENSFKQSYYHNLALNNFILKPIKSSAKYCQLSTPFKENSFNAELRLNRYYLNLSFRSRTRSLFLNAFKYLLNKKSIKISDVIKFFLIFSPFDYRFLFRYF